MPKIIYEILSCSKHFTRAMAKAIDKPTVLKYIRGTDWIQDPSVVVDQLELSKRQQRIKFLVLPDDGVVANEWVWTLCELSKHGDMGGANPFVYDQFGLIEPCKFGFIMKYNTYYMSICKKVRTRGV